MVLDIWRQEHQEVSVLRTEIKGNTRRIMAMAEQLGFEPATTEQQMASITTDLEAVTARLTGMKGETSVAVQDPRQPFQGADRLVVKTNTSRVKGLAGDNICQMELFYTKKKFGARELMLAVYILGDSAVFDQGNTHFITLRAMDRMELGSMSHQKEEDYFFTAPTSVIELEEIAGPLKFIEQNLSQEVQRVDQSG
jgi:hypothetical protein